MTTVGKRWGAGTLTTELATVMSVSSEVALISEIHYTNVTGNFVMTYTYFKANMPVRAELPPYGTARIQLPNSLPDGATIQAYASANSAVEWIASGGSTT